jgi:glycosyltransferase 2 family protein
VVSKRTIVTVARFAVSTAMLAYLLVKVSNSRSSTLPDWSGGTGLWLTGAVVLTLAGIVLSALRWQTVLNALGERTRIGRLLSHYLAGQFVANVLPTTIGGDVLRVSRLSRDTGGTATSFASVVLERLTGWIVLAGVASKRLGGRLDGDSGWRRSLGALHLGLTEMRRRPKAAMSVIAVGFAYQLVLVLAAVMAARALGIPAAGPTALLAFFPAVAIAQVLPISISGLGVREGLFVLFLHPLGVPNNQAVALGLLLYLLNLLVSLLGAPAFAVGGRPRRAMV